MIAHHDLEGSEIRPASCSPAPSSTPPFAASGILSTPLGQSVQPLDDVTSAQAGGLSAARGDSRTESRRQLSSGRRGEGWGSRHPQGSICRPYFSRSLFMSTWEVKFHKEVPIWRKARAAMTQLFIHARHVCRTAFSVAIESLAGTGALQLLASAREVKFEDLPAARICGLVIAFYYRLKTVQESPGGILVRRARRGL
jgi:hypothetical protein